MSTTHMNTYTGLSVDPLALSPEDVREKDIAHALSLLCRGCGHIGHFYSVAQHCLNCAREARARGWSQRLQLACLVHDASEAYVSDLITPVKRRVCGYAEIEEAVEKSVLKHFGLADLSEEERRLVKQIDTTLFANEFSQLMRGWQGEVAPMASVPDLDERPHAEVEAQWLYEAEKLTRTPVTVSNGSAC